MTDGRNCTTGTSACDSIDWAWLNQAGAAFTGQADDLGSTVGHPYFLRPRSPIEWTGLLQFAKAWRADHLASLPIPWYAAESTVLHVLKQENCVAAPADCSAERTYGGCRRENSSRFPRREAKAVRGLNNYLSLSFRARPPSGASPGPRRYRPGPAANSVAPA
jgi:hypothetical protein